MKPLALGPRQTHTMRPYTLSFLVSVGAALFSVSLFAQEPAQPVPPPVPAQQSPQAESSSGKPASGQGAGRHSDDFLVRGTVFTAEGMSLPGAELRIRRSAEKKFRWDAITNSRGDFAVRVKMGSDYEVIVRAKGYQEQSIAVDAKTGERIKDLVFRMQHQGDKKS